MYEAIFADALYAYPTLGDEFERDLIRLRRLVKERGIAIFMVDLPLLGKHLDRCLSEGQYKLSGLPLSKRYSQRTPIPKFLRGLYLLVFDESGHLKEDDCDVEAIIFLRQLLYCAKKAELPCHPKLISQEVVDFVKVDAELPEPETVWGPTPATADDMRNSYTGFTSIAGLASAIADGSHVNMSTANLLVKNLDLVSGFLTTALGTYCPEDWRFRHGPGAIAEKTGPVNKYHWSNWSDRLEARYPIADCGYHNYASWADRGQSSAITSQEACSRLVAVPKTFLKPRLIAAEPSENQWCQQNIWHYFSQRSRESWIYNFVRFRDQSLNQELCKEGSRDGSLITVDLSSASDRVSCAVVGQVFRSNPELLCHLQAVRTRYLRQDICQDVPSLVELRKFSTMGSACTFPIESLIFLVITASAALTAKGVVATSKTIGELVGSVAVFGDDIIAPSDCWVLLRSTLNSLGFKVNDSKSFCTGRFRESCGVDSFRGTDVTPVYWKRLCNRDPESVLSCLETSNNFYKKWFIRSAERVRSTIPLHFAPVAMDSGVSGEIVFRRPTPNVYYTRWNRNLQRLETRTSVLSGTSKKLSPSDDSALLQYFTEAPSPFIQWTAGVALRPRLKIKRGWVGLDQLGSSTENI